MLNQDILDEIKTQLNKAYSDRLSGIVLYGSQARGDASSDSDIDLLVLLDGKIDYGRDLEKNISALYPLSVKLGSRISAKPVNSWDYENFDCPLFRNAHKEGVLF